MASLAVYSMTDILATAAASRAMPPPEAVASLKELARLVGTPGYSRTPNFRAESFENKQWDNFRNFKQTVILKAETKVDEAIVKVRTLLNKLSAANYDATVATLCETVATSPLSEAETAQLCEAIVAISGANAYYAPLYARMTKSLAAAVPGMSAAIAAAVAGLRDALGELAYVPASDYDAFCAMNATKDKRRGQGAYVIGLAAGGVVDTVCVQDIVSRVADTVRAGLDTKDQRTHVEDMVSMLVLFVEQGRAVLDLVPSEQLLADIAAMSRKQHLGLSSKTVCICMDFVDARAKQART